MSDLIGRLRENADLEEDRYPARTIAVPEGHAAFIFRVNGSATTAVVDLIDHDERNYIDG